MWHIVFTARAERDFGKLPKILQKCIIKFFEERVLKNNDPYLFGKALTGRLSGYWSYRVGDYRIIAEIHKSQLQLILIDIDHRSSIYHL